MKSAKSKWNKEAWIEQSYNKSDNNRMVTLARDYHLKQRREWEQVVKDNLETGWKRVKKTNYKNIYI